MEITLVLLLAGLFAAQFFYFRSYIKRHLQKPEGLQEIRKEVDALITELNQNADRNLTLMEQRLGQIQKVLSEADRRLVLLKKAEDKTQSSAQVYSHLQKAKPVVAQEPEAAAAPKAAPDASAEEPRAAVEPPVAGQAPLPAAAAQEKPKSTAAKVQDLAEAGMEPAVIARNLGITLGEVELILSLRRPQGRA